MVTYGWGRSSLVLIIITIISNCNIWLTISFLGYIYLPWGPRWLNELCRWITTYTSLSPIRRGFAPCFVDYKKDALNLQSQVIKFTSCLPMVGGSSPGTPASSTNNSGRHDIAEILLEMALNTTKSINYIFIMSIVQI